MIRGVSGTEMFPAEGSSNSRFQQFAMTRAPFPAVHFSATLGRDDILQSEWMASVLY